MAKRNIKQKRLKGRTGTYRLNCYRNTLVQLIARKPQCTASQTDRQTDMIIIMMPTADHTVCHQSLALYCFRELLHRPTYRLLTRSSAVAMTADHFHHFCSSPTHLNCTKLLTNMVLHSTDLPTTPSSANQRMFKTVSYTHLTLPTKRIV